MVVIYSVLFETYFKLQGTWQSAERAQGDQAMQTLQLKQIAYKLSQNEQIHKTRKHV